MHVINYCSILDQVLYCESLTALVGANGTGKSSFLRSLDLFYSKSPKITVEDYYDKNTASEIVVSVTFKDLPPEAKEKFSKYLQGDKLTVERVFNWAGGKTSGKYHGATLQNPKFQAIRDGFEIKDRNKTAKTAYDDLRALPEYNTLPVFTSRDAVQENLKHWETDHAEKCVRQRDEGQFFGFSEVAEGYLGRFTRFLLIPAVREASDDSSEGRGTALTSLMDLVVRSVLANKEAVLKLREETQRQYKEIMDPENLTELSGLADKLTGTLRTFVPNATIDLRWLPFAELDIPMPQADVRLVEDGYPCPVERTGHGLQRAFILTMFQHLAMAQSVATPSPSESDVGATLPNLILAVEEPELYQHPNRQRHLAKLFLRLASGKTPGVAERTQILYGTHSPLFVGIDRIDQIRLLRKIGNGDGKPKITKVVSTSLGRVAHVLAENADNPTDGYSATTLSARLQAVMTPWMNEGFFADAVVLVEGEDDRAAILGVAKAMGHDLEGNGYSIIPCGGKSNIDRPYVIFRQLNIPVYVVWDGDAGSGETAGKCDKCDRPLDKKPDPKENRRFMRLLGLEETDWPESIGDSHACFSVDLETTIQKEIGKELFEELLESCKQHYGISKRRHAIKNVNVINDIIENAQSRDRQSSTLQSIIGKILALQADPVKVS